jgi:hypothetical protein
MHGEFRLRLPLLTAVSTYYSFNCEVTAGYQERRHSRQCPKFRSLPDISELSGLDMH